MTLRKRAQRVWMICLGCVAAWPLSACMLGPTALEHSRVRYNEVLQRTTKEQLLLNLVRLQYREPPLFLNVENVAAQFRFSESADVRGTINEGPNPINPDVLAIGAGVVYEERPTITFTPLQGKEFAQRFLKPFDLGLVFALERSGWSIDRLLRVMVQKMNTVDNASGASGPTPTGAPQYEAFIEMTGLFRSLQLNGMLRLGRVSRPNNRVVTVPAQSVDLLDIVEAQQRGYTVANSADGKSLTLTGSEDVFVWHIPPEAQDSQEVRRIVELLDLEPGLDNYELRAGLTSQIDNGDHAAKGRVIHILTRSLMGTMFYLSQAVEAPPAHRERNFVTTTLRGDGSVFDWVDVTGDLLTVRSQRRRPSGAATAVRHLGYWFYIDNDCTTTSSKSTFGLLGQIFALQAGSTGGPGPTLTLPVGG